MELSINDHGTHTEPLPNPVTVHNASGKGRAILVCEHASNFIPADYAGLGLSAADLQRHIAWDIGAHGTAQQLAERLDAPLVSANYSRLLLDLNRPLSAQDSITEHSEDTPIPGNQALTEREIQRRHSLYAPFHQAVDALIAHRLAESAPAVISIHSFTPVYHGKKRPWHIGVLSQHDRRLADALLAVFRHDSALCVGDNQPYAPDDGVYHSMQLHGESHALPCVMLEIRNDLITDTASQTDWADRIALAIETALAELTPLERQLPGAPLYFSH
jgi:predicted N-formylglutamate amidohydrolase